MILRFLTESSQNPVLRHEFNQNPEAVMDRYEIPESQQEILLEADREKIGLLLHQEIDRMRADYYAIIWPDNSPLVVGQADVRHGESGQPVEIKINARNVKAPVAVRFRKAHHDVAIDAAVLDVEVARGDFFTVRCQATFPEPGDYDVILANEEDFTEKFSTKASYFHAD